MRVMSFVPRALCLEHWMEAYPRAVVQRAEVLGTVVWPAKGEEGHEGCVAFTRIGLGPQHPAGEVDRLCAMQGRWRHTLCLAYTTSGMVLLLAGCSREESSSTIPPAASPGSSVASVFVGRDACVVCHQAEHDAHADSHHDLAMQPANAETVLGDFADASFEHFGVVSRFFTRDGGYFVETDSPDGTIQEYRVEYTFGVDPLQQYLVAFPGGRLQVLPLCWDTRPEALGGQRWFHLYPDDPVPAGDILHWTGPNQNWNFMCAECHSTDLHKNYDLATETFDTTWTEIDVSCEACHGPGSVHVAWAEREGQDAHAADALEAGLTVDLADRDGGRWVFAPDAPTAHRSKARQTHAEIESCARCHARRTALTDDYQHGLALLDSHRVSLLTEPEYFADGQVREENYVYGSFLQSSMYAAGVTCTDCHEPHSARLWVEDDVLCFRCHSPREFGGESHSHHPADEETGREMVSCVGCHMPVRTYMVVDDRHDHSFRVPRPDLSEKLGTPNACTLCHAEEDAAWAAGHVAEWFGEDRRQEWRYGEALHAGHWGQPGAADALARLAHDPEQPAIARATGLALFARYPGAELVKAVRAGVMDKDPVVRLGVLAAVEGVVPEDRLRLVGELLGDPVLAVRVEAARVLAISVTEALPSEVQQAFEMAAADFVATQLANAERPESHIGLAAFYTDLARFEDAEREYRVALELDPANIAAAVNFADLRREQGRDTEGEQILREVLRRSPRSAAARHALGLTLIRLGQR
ncbi:probable deca-heme c-type cytochrome, partial [hydrothermal vent metagenome]